MTRALLSYLLAVLFVVLLFGPKGGGGGVIVQKSNDKANKPASPGQLEGH